jgi:glycosyltransferase involved in cell wall biosynthesis
MAVTPNEDVARTDRFYKDFAANYKTFFKYTNYKIFNLLLRSLRVYFGLDFTKTHNKVIRYIKSKNVKIVWFGYGNISYDLIKKVHSSLPHVKLICDTDSVWSRFILRELPYADPSRSHSIKIAGRNKELEEKEWVNLCDVTTAVSLVDSDYYKSIAQDPSKIHLFSNVIDVDEYKENHSPPLNFKTPSLILAGTYHKDSAMSLAADWVIQKVLPILHKSHPDIHLFIVGKGSDREFGSLNNNSITVTGKVDSVLPYLCNSSLAIVPLHFESGTRFKIMEAGICKIPIVSTTLGAEGLPLENRKHLLISDTPNDFAKSIIEVLENKNLADYLVHNCYNFILKNCSIENLKTEASNIMKYIQDD